AASVVRTWDAEGPGRGLRFLPLYVMGLLGAGLALHGLALSPERLGQVLTLTVAGYVLATTAVGWVAPRLEGLRKLIQLPARTNQGPEPWLLPVQLGFGGIVLALAVWISFSFPERLDRFAGPLAVALVTAAAVLATRLRELGAAPLWLPTAA